MLFGEHNCIIFVRYKHVMNVVILECVYSLVCVAWKMVKVFSVNCK